MSLSEVCYCLIVVPLNVNHSPQLPRPASAEGQFERWQPYSINSQPRCSDLHMYEGRTAAEAGIVFGHENMGIVDEVGPGVTVGHDHSREAYHPIHPISASQEGRPCRHAIQRRMWPLPELRRRKVCILH